VFPVPADAKEQVGVGPPLPPPEPPFPPTDVEPGPPPPKPPPADVIVENTELLP
jgi:hypothetical protein